MVDKDKIRDLYIHYFDTDQEQINTGSVSIDDDGTVSVDDSVYLLKEVSKLPIKLQSVQGNFDAYGSGLETLENFPHYVGNDLIINSNNLESLRGAPDHVGGALLLTHNPLTTLEGFPSHVGGKVTITWSENLPLLRTLIAREIILYGKPRVMVILNKYAGQGRRGMFACKKELIEAGFEGNARW
jgi:hypothetical protein